MAFWKSSTSGAAPDRSGPHECVAVGGAALPGAARRPRKEMTIRWKGCTHPTLSATGKYSYALFMPSSPQA
jgi:hypothetical protein